MIRKTALTPTQVRGRFRRQGLTFTRWAADNGYSRETVYRVLNGRYAGNYGQAYEIAVALGLKVPDAEPITGSETRNTQTRSAA